MRIKFTEESEEYTMICKDCGAQIEDNAEVCPFCGAVYKEGAEVEEKQDSNTASNEEKETESSNEYSEELSDNSDFEPVSEETEDNETDSDVEELFDENEIKRQRQIERNRAEKQSQLEEIERRRQEKKKRQRRTKIIAIVIIAACVAGGVFAGIKFLGNGDNGNEVVLSTEQPSESALPEATLPVVATPDVSQSPAPTQSSSWQATGGSTSSGSSSSGSSSSGGTSSSGSNSSRPSSGGSSSGSSSSSGTSSRPSSGSSGSSSSGSSGGSSAPSTSTAVTGGKTYSAPGGMSGERFTSALVTGGQVITDGGRTYMTFVYDGNTYYANVDSGAYTAFIQGKPMTLSAFPTSEVYNGNKVYEITSITHYNGDYIFPNSGFELLTEADLKGKSAEVLALGRNEIFARHGRTFTMPEFQNYFNGCSWYSPNPNYNYDDDASNLNSIERQNANFIKAYEDKLK